MTKLTRKQSMEAMCKACIYDPNEPGNWRQQVQECTADGRMGRTLCPLHAWRPLSVSKRKKVPV